MADWLGGISRQPQNAGKQEGGARGV